MTTNSRGLQGSNPKDQQSIQSERADHAPFEQSFEQPTGQLLQRSQVDPRRLTPAEVMTMQRTVGNGTVSRMLNNTPSDSTPRMRPLIAPRVQRKAKVGPGDDRFEQEANQMARHVTTQVSAPTLEAKVPRMQRKFRRKDENKQDPMVGGAVVNPDIEHDIRRTSSRGRPLSGQLRNKMEGAFNADFSSVRIHTGQKADTLNRSLSAQAFTYGSNIYFQNGAFAPGSRAGGGLLAHELTHTIQQGGAIQRSPDVVRQQTRPVVQRRSDKNLKIDREAVAGAKSVLGKLANRNWAEAIKEYRENDVTYSKAGFWGSMTWVKGIRGVGNLNTYRLQAKRLFEEQVGRESSDKETRDPEENVTPNLLDSIATIAQNTFGESSDSSYEWQLQHRAAIMQKVAHYLVRSLPIGVLNTALTELSTSAKPKDNVTPQAILLMGGSGAGKSSMISKLGVNTNAMVHADPDAIKEAMPKYRAGVKSGNKDIASQVHTDSKNITKSLTHTAIANKQHLLYDRTGAELGDYQDVIKKLKENGYKIALLMAHVTPQEGLARVQKRAQETGRSVPDKVVLNVYKWLPQNFMTLMPLVDDAQLYDNMGTGPQLVWEKPDGEEIGEEFLEQLKLHLDLITPQEDKEYTERLDSGTELTELNMNIKMNYTLSNKEVPEELLERQRQLKEKAFKMISLSGSNASREATKWAQQSKDSTVPEEQKSKAAQLAKKYGLTKSEMAAIFIFTAPDYKYMNPALAGNMPWLKTALTELPMLDKELQKTISQQSKTEEGISEEITTKAIKEGKTHFRYMKSGLNKLPNFVGTTYRGASFTPEEMQRYYPAKGTATFPTMSSSSVNMGTARGFAKTTKKEGKNSYLFTLQMKRGKTVAEFSNSPGEAEIIIMAGSQFSVDSIVEPVGEGEDAIGEVHLTQVR